MDKNTIYGLLLMAAIFFGFMWLQPKNENPDAQKNATDDAPAAQSASSGADSLSASEREWLVSNIAENGTVKVLADSSRVTTIDEACTSHFAATASQGQWKSAAASSSMPT